MIILLIILILLAIANLFLLVNLYKKLNMKIPVPQIFDNIKYESSGIPDDEALWVIENARKQ